MMTLPERAAALAVQLANSRIITPVLTDDAAHLDVTLDVAAILAALEAVQVTDAMVEAALQAQHGYYPDYPFNAMAYRSMRAAIQALFGPPDGKG